MIIQIHHQFLYILFINFYHMIINTIIIFTTLLSLSLQQNCTVWGIRISLGDYYMDQNSNTYMYVGFNTIDTCISSRLQFEGSNIACNSTFIQTPTANYTTNVHVCTIQNLHFTNDYYSSQYRVIGVDSLSNQYPAETISFKLINKHIKTQYQAIMLGDWGVIYPNCTQCDTIIDIIPALNNFINSNTYAFAMFMGDIAYDFCDQKGVLPPANISCTKYQQSLTAFQFLTSKVPFMPTVGNHQYGPDRPNSRMLAMNTFLTPFKNVDTYFFEIGQVHYQTFNAFEQVQLKDLSQVDNKVNQLKSYYKKKGQKIDWVIPFGHYPFYCAGYVNNSDCINKRYQVQMAKFIDYFHQYNIDLYLGAHIHYYLRTKPINIQGQVGKYQDKSTNQVTIYYKSQDPIYIYQGSAGNSDYVELGQSPLYSYQAIQFTNTGFSVLKSIPNQKIFQNQHIFGNGIVAQTVIIQKDKKIWIAFLLLGICIVVFVGVLALLFVLIKKQKNKGVSQLEQAINENSLMS